MRIDNGKNKRQIQNSTDYLIDQFLYLPVKMIQLLMKCIVYITNKD